MITLAVGNHKGGSGKTTTAYELAHILSRRRRVLAVDLDPQAALSGVCGVEDADGASMADVLSGGAGVASIVRRIAERFDLAPAALSLAGAELALVSRMGRENVIARALAPVANTYDVCLIDCPPSLGLLTVGALVAAHGVIAPTIPQQQDIRALAQFTDTVNTVRREMGARCELVGVVLTNYDARLTHHNDARAALDAAGYSVMRSTISRSIRVAESVAALQPITDYAPDSPPAHDYLELAKEIEKWLKQHDLSRQ